MTELAFAPASTLDAPARAALFTAAYEDYVVPFRLEEQGLLFMERAFGTALDESLLALADGEPVGLANLAKQGADGWVAGVGVVKERRGSGLGEALMRELIERARALGVRRLWLEVIVENVAATKLYEKLGFRHVRGLEVWTLPGSAAGVALAPLDEAHEWIRARRDWREPWQRTDETVARMQELDPAPVGVRVDGGAAVVRVSDGRVTVVQAAADSDEAYEALFRTAAAAGESVLLLNLPEGHPAAGALERLGGSVSIRQHEMLLEL